MTQTSLQSFWLYLKAVTNVRTELMADPNFSPIFMKVTTPVAPPLGLRACVRFTTNHKSHTGRIMNAR